MKKLFIILAVLLMTVGLSAQNRWTGFLDPVSADQIKGLSSDKSKSVTTLIRPQLSVAGMAFKLQYDELGNFDKVASSFVSRAGMGISLSHFKLVNDQPYNDYSFAAMVSIATTENPNAGFMLTASALNLYGLSPNIGIGYDIVKGLSFKQNIFFVWGATVKFD